MIVGSELRRMRRARNISLEKLSRLVNFSKGHLSNVERGTRQATEDLVVRCDVALEAEGQLIEFFQQESQSADARPRSVWTAPSRPAQLPPTIGDFVGRPSIAAELDQILNAAVQTDAPRVVVLDGPAGTGKTTLAIWWAHRHRRRFPDGALYADLHGFDATDDAADPSMVLEMFIRGLGVPAADCPDEMGGRAALFRTLVDGKRMLFVLDNARTADQVRPLLPGSSGCLVLVTSRSRLAGLVVHHGARRVGIGPLSAGQCRELLRHVVGDRIDAEPAAADSLAEQCGRQPLALRIAAFRVASRAGTSLAEMVKELRDEHGRLEMLDTGDDSAAVRSAFSWSFRALPADSAQLFSLLGLHPPGRIQVAAVAALSGQQESASRSQLRILNNHHLVEEVSRDKVALQDLIHLYAAERARNLVTADARERATERMFRWYLATAEAADTMIAPWQQHPELADIHDIGVPGAQCRSLSFADAGDALMWCDDTIDTLLSISRRAHVMGYHSVAVRLPLAISGYFKLRKPRSIWITMHDLGLRSARATADRPSEAWLLHNLATAYFHLCGYVTASRLFSEALSIRLDIDNHHGAAWCRLGLGFSLWKQYENAKAQSELHMAQSLLVGHPDQRAEGLIKVGLGGTYGDLGDLDSSIGLLTEAVKIFTVSADLHGSGLAKYHLGVTYQRLGRHYDALDALDEALDAQLEIGDKSGASETLVTMGSVLNSMGESARAKQVNMDARVLQQESTT